MSDAGRVHIANSEVLSRIWYTAVFAPTSPSLNKQLWLAVGGFVRRGTHLHTVRQNRGPPAEAPAAAAGAAGTAGGDMTTGNPPLVDMADEASPANGADPELHDITAGGYALSSAASDGHPTVVGVATNLETDNTAGGDAAQGGNVGASGTAVVTA